MMNTNYIENIMKEYSKNMRQQELERRLQALVRIYKNFKDLETEIVDEKDKKICAEILSELQEHSVVEQFIFEDHKLYNQIVREEYRNKYFGQSYIKNVWNALINKQNHD